MIDSDAEGLEAAKGPAGSTAARWDTVGPFGDGVDGTKTSDQVRPGTIQMAKPDGRAGVRED